MSPSAGRHLLVSISAVVLLASSGASAFNITMLLGRYPGFEQFNQLLSRTQLAEDINSRRTITVLGIPTAGLSALMQLSESNQKTILSLHVLLDYYDMAKINKLPLASKTTVTTLYQSSGVAGDKQGQIDIIHRRDGNVVFASSVPGSPLVCNLLNPVFAQPYNISLLSVSQPIIAPGMDGSEPFPVGTPPPPAAAAAPVAAKNPPPPASPVAEEPVAEEPATADAQAPAPSPADAPAPGPNADAEAPAADEAEESPDQVAVTKKSGGAGKEVVSGVMIGLAWFLAVAL